MKRNNPRISNLSIKNPNINKTQTSILGMTTIKIKIKTKIKKNIISLPSWSMLKETFFISVQKDVDDLFYKKLLISMKISVKKFSKKREMNLTAKKLGLLTKNKKIWKRLTKNSKKKN